MIDSGIFDKKDIINWEDKIQANKTWAKAQEYVQSWWPAKKDMRP